MWAVESGIVNPDVQDDITDYQCAEAFRWSPEVTAVQGVEKTEALLLIHRTVQEKNKRDAESAASSGRHARSF